MDFEAVKQYVMKRLSSELDKDLTYHCPEHTLDVIESAERLAKMEGLNGMDLTLVKTAALFHDIGFLESYHGHENISMRMAGEILPEFGYTSRHIKYIQGTIKSTEVPQKPTNKLEEIIADADLDYLGRDDLFLIGQRLQYEWLKQGIISSLKEWHVKQLEFLKAHKYFTGSAIKTRGEKKLKNIEEIEILMCLKK